MEVRCENNIFHILRMWSEMEGEEGSHLIPTSDHGIISKHPLDLLESRDKWVQRAGTHCFKSCKSASSLQHVLTKPCPSAHIFDRSSTAY